MADTQAKTMHLNDENFQAKLDEAKEAGMPILVDFYAEWCGPCKMAAPVIDKLSNDYDGKMMIAKLNVDEARETAQQHSVMSIPTVIVFKDGEEVDRTIGFPGEDGYVQLIENNLQ